MHAELLLAMSMANLAGAWDALAAQCEQHPLADERLRVRAAAYRDCAADLRDRLELHRTGPAWAAPWSN